MIIIMDGSVNPLDVTTLTQDEYDRLIDQLNLKALKCHTCGHTGFECHSYYERSVAVENPFRLLVKRIRCQDKNCNKTHALLPQSLVPYSKIPLKTTVEVIKLKNEKDIREFLNTVPYLVEDVIRMVQKKYKKHWEQRLISQKIQLDDNLSDHCLDLFGYQFMQIRFPQTIAYRQFHLEYPSLFDST